MIYGKILLSLCFVPYGTECRPEPDTLVLDVGMKTVPGVIDHHHPDAEPECTASLIVKYPFLVTDHVSAERYTDTGTNSVPLRIITHRLPDFDAAAALFLSLKLLEKGECDRGMEEISRYTKMVDSATLPKTWDLPSTPYAILRGLFLRIRKEERAANPERIREGLALMNFLYDRFQEGYEITANKALFSGIERYAAAIKRAEEDYFHYLHDLERGRKILLFLPDPEGMRKIRVDGLVVRNPRSYLLKEWARRDNSHPSLGRGFSFLMTTFGEKRIIMGVDPEAGVTLKGLGDLLNHRECSKRKKEGRPLLQRWYDGNCPFFNFRIIDSPQDGTSLSHEEVMETILEFGESG